MAGGRPDTPSGAAPDRARDRGGGEPVSTPEPGGGTAAGVAAGLGAALIWGLGPLYFDLLAHVPPTELLAHRVLWGAAFVLAFCLATGRGPRLAATLGDRGLRARLAGTAGLITINWFAYLVAIQSGRVTEAGFGYYLMPLVSVALGVAVLGERLSLGQWLAVGLAAAAVGVLALGQAGDPLIPLVLAFSFGLYGLARKRMGVGAVTGFAAEALILAPFAAAGLALIGLGLLPGRGTVAADAGEAVLLLLAGPVTGLPLILFAEAARRLSYATTGLVTYLNPTVQVALAATVLGETLTPTHALALVLLWAGLGLYTRELWRAGRRPARPPVPPAA